MINEYSVKNFKSFEFLTLCFYFIYVIKIVKNMENKTKLTPELMYDMGFLKAPYTNIWYQCEYEEIDDNIPCGINIDNDYERPRYRVILGETVFCCTYKEDLIEEFNITL